MTTCITKTVLSYKTNYNQKLSVLLKHAIFKFLIFFKKITFYLVPSKDHCHNHMEDTLLRFVPKQIFHNYTNRLFVKHNTELFEIKLNR